MKILKKKRIIVTVLIGIIGKAFMEEDQQDSGGEYDLQEGFDRFRNLRCFINTIYMIYTIPTMVLSFIRQCS